uniref:Uncharacterized protein n=1 Tax=Arundo donax TaxID=35708 RepID=A0A0A9BD01_ARUDO
MEVNQVIQDTGTDIGTKETVTVEV